MIEIKWSKAVVRDRVKAMRKRWGAVWTHASPEIREALALEVAFGFLTCRDDVEMSGLDVRNLIAVIREAAELD